MKHNLISILDQTYPGVNTYFDDLACDDGSQKWVDFVTTYWHMDCVRSMTLNAFVGVDLGIIEYRSNNRKVFQLPSEIPLPLKRYYSKS